jgi:uncharacterized protein YndB with AHSA1/START domain
VASPGNRQLELREPVAAPPERVWTLLTDPGELVRWWGPDGFSIPEVRVDLRVPGAYRFTMQPPDGEAFHLAGEFREIDPPRRLSYTFRWEEPTPDDRETVVVLTLEPAAGGTALALSQGSFATEERLLLHRDGWSQSLEKLRTLVDRTPAR